jgi:predicted DNA-binding protein YlxM (UPF0122 family)
MEGDQQDLTTKRKPLQLLCSIKKNSINFIEDNLNISRSTIYQYLGKEGEMVNGFKKSKLLK